MQRTKIQVEKLHSLRGHRDSVYTLAQGMAPWQLFSAGADGFVVQWDLRSPETGLLLAKLSAAVYAIHFDPASAELTVGQNHDGLHIIDVSSKKVIGSVKLTTAAIFDIQRTAKDILVATGDGVIIVVDRATLAVRKHIKAGSDRARSMALSANGQMLTVAYSDNCIRQFAMEDFKLMHEWEAHTNSVFHVRYQPNQDVLLSVSRDAQLKIWEVGQQPKLKSAIVAHMYAINHLDFSPDGKHFVTCSMDKSIKVWDAESYQLLKVIDKARHASHGTSVNRVLWTPYENQMVSASDDRTLTVWHLSPINEA
jgi:WD40 repeat protein